MFAKGKAVREATKAKMREKVLEEERRRIETVLTRHGVQLDKEVVDDLLDNSRNN